MKNSMRLITSSWGPAKTFKMIPTTKECPYNECIFDVNTKVLAIISKESKESLHMLPKLTEVGDVMRLKIGKKENGKDYAEERKALVTFYEYYIEDKDEIIDFVTRTGENAESFDFQQYINLEIPKEGMIPQNNIITSVV
jgi:hypothetical protein